MSQRLVRPARTALKWRHCHASSVRPYSKLRSTSSYTSSPSPTSWTTPCLPTFLYPHPYYAVNAVFLRSFTASAQVSATQAMTEMPQGRRKNRKAFSAQSAEMSDMFDMPNDNGLFPGTFVKPPRAKRPSWFSNFWERFALERAWIHSKIENQQSLIVWWWTFRRSKRGPGQPRPSIGLRSIPSTAAGLYESVYRALVDQDRKKIERLTAEGLHVSLINRINAISPHERWRWECNDIRTHTCSVRSTPLPIETRKNEGPSMLLQAVVRIDSKQELRTRDIFSENLRPGQADPDVFKETICEYFVIQRRVWKGVLEPWLAWGMTRESSLDDWREGRKEIYKLRSQAAAQKRLTS